MNRVVVTGLGVLAPNGHGLDAFEKALREGRTGIRYYEKLKELKFGCQLGGMPQEVEEIKARYFSTEALLSMKASVVLFGSIAAVDCWKDAGLSVPEPGDERVDWDTGAIMGTGVGAPDLLCEYIGPMVTAGKGRRMGSTMVEQVMASGVSARLAGLLGLGGQVSTNSSACTTGTEAVIEAFFHIKAGRAQRMLAGGSEGNSHFTWAAFDSMHVMTTAHNAAPEKASRPMSASASGFVPSSGAGVLMLESLDSARKRGARIYAEILGGHLNCGGHRGGGSMTAPNPEGVQRCIREAVRSAGIQPSGIDAINGHLTATHADPGEVKNWQAALGRSPDRLPWINSTKSLIGHALGAAGGIECVGSILQLSKGFVHGSLNCEDVHPELEAFKTRIPHRTVEDDIQILAKSSFGFGDVNGCIIFKKWGTDSNG